MTQSVLYVPDISCGHCAQTVQKALKTVEGVQNVLVDVESKKVQVSYDEQRASLDAMKRVLAEEEYPVASVEQA